jgi:hypothetical protein
MILFSYPPKGGFFYSRFELGGFLFRDGKLLAEMDSTAKTHENSVIFRAISAKPEHFESK